ncbi:MAG TPA: class I SAM-dependent methyltransferase [Deltaproteobacteria bacterium]|jgi:predicted O-methyltransferase YrrM|nr:class I SAM-dependent methyltransferase [Deltaproteobacteria bacterium]
MKILEGSMQDMRVEDIPAMNIKGFLDHEEGVRLHEIACRASLLGPCLEIGGYCGKSTVYLGLGCRSKGGILFSIDHHRGSEEQQPGQEYFDPELLDPATGRVDTFRLFRDSIERAGLEDTVIPLVTRSEVAARMWSMPLGLVFIDGGHSYPTVFSDYTAWMPHVVPGGWLLIHDIFPDPNDGGQAPYYVYNLAIQSGLFVEVERVKTLGVLRRRAVGEVPDEVGNRRDWG